MGIVDIGIVEGSGGMRSDPGKARPLSERRLQRLRQVREPDADVQPDIRPLDDDPVLEVQVSKPPTD